MTEEEARNKWCPMARTVSDTRNFATANRLVDRGPNNADSDCMCISSECMMWRWDNDETGCCKQNGQGLDTYQGWCGLGGKP